MITKWKVDPMHSEVQFKVKHLMITTITGYFTAYALEVQTEDNDFTQACKIEFSADINSISTNNEQRDGHLKSADFFDVTLHPAIIFVGNKFEKQGDSYLVHGDLTIKSTTRPVTVQVEFGGIAVDGYNQTKAGFSVTGKISRKNFGLTWEGVTEAGSIIVSDEIKISCEIQLIREN